MKKLIMAIKSLGKVIVGGNETTSDKSPQVTSNLSEKELNFVLTKLREATYKGSEFEMFYNVFTKLTNQKPK